MHVAEEIGLSLALSETLMTGFVASMPNYYFKLTICSVNNYEHDKSYAQLS